jgi:hypothetical protein
MSTRAVDVSIQAVSPALILSAPINVGSVGAAAAAAAAAGGVPEGASAAADGDALDASSAHAAGIDNAKTPRQTNRHSLFIDENPLFESNGAGVPLTRPDAHHLRELEDENLSVSHLSGLS